MNTAQSSAAVDATPLHEFTSFDQGDLANILHDLRNSVRDLTHRMNTSLTPAVAGLSFVGRQGTVPPPIDISHAPRAAPPGPFYSNRAAPPHLALSPANTNGPRYVPPHRSQQSRDDRFPDLPIREPSPITSIRFSGACVELETFLLDIREQLRIFEGCFSSDKAKINWVARHFGVKDTKVGSTSHTWFMGLLKQNAYEQGAVTLFEDLYALPYTLKPLTTLAEFFAEMVLIFSDKEAESTARKALNACNQGNSNISDYNNRFLSVVFTVPLTEQSRIIQYVAGLHPDLLYCCNFQQGWSNIATLTQKMLVASEASKVLDSISSLKTTNLFNPRRQLPPRPNPTPRPPLQFGIPVNRDPNAMDIDVAALDPSNPMSAIKRICWERKLCFYCLRAFDSSHRNDTTRKCPNNKATAEERLALLKSSIPAQTVAAVEEDDDYFTPAQQLEAQSLVQSYWESVNQIPSTSFPQTDELLPPSTVDLAVVRISGDMQHSNKFIIPLKIPGSDIVMKALVDTGSQGCFINKKFATNQDMNLSEKSPPICCLSFDGTPGVGGLVDKEWVGLAGYGESKFPLALGATNLGKHDAILGLPWLDSVNAKITCGPHGRFLEFEGCSVAAVETEDICNVVS